MLLVLIKKNYIETAVALRECDSAFTSVTPERSFSIGRRLYTWLRSTLT